MKNKLYTGSPLPGLEGKDKDELSKDGSDYRISPSLHLFLSGLSL